MSQTETIAGLGRRGDKVASAPRELLGRISLSDQECQVLACIGRNARISDVLDRCGLAEPEALNALLMLRAKGAVLPLKKAKRPAPEPLPRSSPIPTEPVQAASAPTEDPTRAEERRRRLARHPYLLRVKRALHSS